MDFDRYASEIATQTALLVADVAGADLHAPVPSCPEWTLGGLLRHIGGGQRWAAGMVRTRSTEYQPDSHFRDVAGDDSGEVPAAWLLSGGRELADALLEAGPDSPCWGPFGYDTASFIARRFTHETLIHRADATLAAGVPFAAAEDVALDAVDEWMELDAFPQHFEITPAKRELLGPGRTLAFEATDADARWYVDLTGDVIRWRRGGGEAAVTVRAPLTDVLLLIYRRKALSDKGFAVSGDTGLLDFWLGHVAFG